MGTSFDGPVVDAEMDPITAIFRGLPVGAADEGEPAPADDGGDCDEVFLLLLLHAVRDKQLTANPTTAIRSGDTRDLAISTPHFL
jgi:hypothetical protein